MGNVNTFLTEDDYQQIHDETGFSESQIRRLYSRFAHLDKRSKGYLMRNGKSSIETINFRQFVRTLARFKKSPRAQEGGLNTRDMKLDFVFKVYDTDRDGKISKEDLQHVLSAMVGLHIPKDQLNSIVRRTMKEADENEDNLIDMGEFTRCLEQLDLDDKMSIRFSQT
ncbi:calcineurin B homologous protein 1-like isoform X3 [Halichondria panicea]|uniref:calcineurin B homologous protein 1-like isoform X3 n=1 Tax=Halichondria panicea TaxID=6063 RepID=UPI00312B8CC2